MSAILIISLGIYSLRESNLLMRRLGLLRFSHSVSQSSLSSFSLLGCQNLDILLQTNLAQSSLSMIPYMMNLLLSLEDFQTLNWFLRFFFLDFYQRMFR